MDGHAPTTRDTMIPSNKLSVKTAAPRARKANTASAQGNLELLAGGELMGELFLFESLAGSESSASIGNIALMAGTSWHPHKRMPITDV
jgi:hypothetical protein